MSSKSTTLHGSSKDAREKTKDGIRSLIKALHDHRKFKRMCVFSLKAMIKALCPPNTDWERNVKLFVKEYGIGGVVKILENYPGDADILEDCTTILAQIPKPRPEGKLFAYELVKERALIDTLKSMKKNPHLKKGVKNAMGMVRMCTQANAIAVSNKEHVDAIFDVVDTFEGNEDVVSNASSTFDYISRRKRAAIAFTEQKTDGLTRLIGMLNCKGSTAESVYDQLNAIRRLVRYSDANIAVVENSEGLKAVVSVLEAYPDNEKIQLVGSKIINCVAGANIDRILADVANSKTPKADREYDAQLLASLAIKTKNAKKIVDLGGIAKMIGVVKDPAASPKLVASALLVLRRIGYNDGLRKQEVDADALKVVVETIKKYPTNAHVEGAAIGALENLVVSPQIVKAIDDLGGVDAVMKILKEHPDYAEASLQAMRFIGKILDNGYDANRLIKLNGVEAVLGAIRAHKGVEVVAANGLTALQAMAESSNQCALDVAKMGGIKVAVENIVAFKDNPKIVISGLKLLSALATNKENVKAIVEMGGVTAIVEAVYACGDANPEIRSVGDALLKALVGRDAVLQVIQSLKKNVGPMVENGDVKAADAVRSALQALTIFSGFVPDVIQRNGGVPAVLKAFDRIERMPKSKGVPQKTKTACVNGCFRMLDAMVRNGRGIEPQLVKDLLPPLESKGSVGLPRIVAFVQANPKKSRSNLKYALRLLQNCCDVGNRMSAHSRSDDGGNNKMINALVDANLVEACAAALKSNATKADVCTPALETLANLAADPTHFGGLAIVDHQGTRQMLKTLSKIRDADDDGMQPARLALVRALEGVANIPKGRKRLNKEKCVEKLVGAMTAMQGRKGEHEFQRGANRVIAKLVDADAVKELTLDLVRSVEEVEPKRKKLEALRDKLRTVALVARVGDKNAKIVAANGGPGAFVKTLLKVDKYKDSDAKRDCLAAALDGLGILIKTDAVSPDLYKSAVPIIVAQFKESKNLDALLCLSRFVESGDKSVAAAVMGVAEDLVALLRDDDGSDPTVAALVMRTLAALAAQDEKSRDRLAKIGALEEVLDWIQQNGDEAPAETVARALDFLANMSLSGTHAGAIGGHRAFETVVDTLTDRPLTPRAMTSGLNLLGNLAQTDKKAAAALNDAGVCGRILNMFNLEFDDGDEDSVRSAYVHDDDTATACTKFILRAAKNSSKDGRENLKMQKADRVVMRLMTENPNCKSVQTLGAEVLSLLLTPADMLRDSARKVETIVSEKLDGAPRKYIKPLISELNQLLNASRVAGALDAKSGAKLIDLVSRTLKKVDALADDGKITDADAVEARAACYELLGQLAKMKIRGANLADPTGRICDRLVKEGASNLTRRERLAMLSALDALAQDPKALEAMRARDPDLSRALLELAGLSDGDDASRSKARGIAMILTKASVLKGCGVAENELHFRNALAKLAAGGLSDEDAKVTLGVFKHNLDLIVGLDDQTRALASKLNGLSGDALASAARDLLNQMRARDVDSNVELIKSIMAIAKIDPDGIKGALRQVQSWMPESELGYLLLAMGLSDDAPAQVKRDLEAIQGVVLENYLDQIRAEDFEPEDDLLNALLNYIEDANANVRGMSNVDDDTPLVVNVRCALRGVDGIAHHKDGPELIAKNGRGVPILQMTSLEPKFIWSSLKGGDDDAKTTDDDGDCPAVLATRTLAYLAGLRNKDIDAQMLKLGVCKTNLDAMLENSNNEAYVAANMLLLSNLVNGLGVDGCVGDDKGFNKVKFKTIEGIQGTFKQNGQIQASGDNIRMKLKKLFPGSFKEEMADFTMSLDTFGDVVRSVTLERDTDGTLTFIMNKKKSKKPPPEWDDLDAQLTKGRDMVLKYKGKADEVGLDVVKNLTSILKNASRDPDIAEKVATMLNFYATNEKNLKMIEKAGGIEAIIEALRRNPDSDRLAKTLLMLLDKFCDHDVLKERIGKAGAVEVIVAACNAQAKAAKVALGEGLPPNVIACRDAKTGKTYYYDTVTRKSSWKKPKPAMPPVKLDYVRKTDKDGRTFYQHRDTGKKVWELPEAEAKKMMTSACRLDRCEHHLLLIQLLTILSRLTYMSEVNTSLAIKWKGIPYLTNVLKAFPESPRIVEVAVNNLSNWIVALGLDSKRAIEVGLEIAERTSVYVVDALRRMYLDTYLFVQVLNFFGNLSCVSDDCVAILLRESRGGCVRVVADHVDATHLDEDVKETAIKVLGNFAKSSETVETRTGDEDNTICMQIFSAGGADAILSMAKRYKDNSGLVYSAVEALNDIAQERPAGVSMPGTSIACALVKQGLVEFVVHMMQMMDYDVDMMVPTVELAATALDSADGLARFLKAGGLQSLEGIVETHATNEDILVNGTVALHILAEDPSRRKMIDDAGVVDTVLKFLLDHPTHAEFVPEALAMLSRMAASDGDFGAKMRTLITEEGMATIMGVVHSNRNNTLILERAFKLVGFLALRRDSIPKIVQMQGLDHIMDAIDNHSEDMTLMSRCMQTLEFIVSEEGFAELVDKKGGTKRIKKIVAKYRKTPAIQESGRTALLFLAAKDGLPDMDGNSKGELMISSKDISAAENMSGPPPEFPDDLFM